MTASDCHLDSALLIRLMDDELDDDARSVAEAHLAVCGGCKSRYRELALLSSRVESLVAATPAKQAAGLRRRLEAQMSALADSGQGSLVSWRLGWGMAIAAGLALGLLFLPQPKSTSGVVSTAGMSSSAAGTLEIDGETFVSLPYSNADLPLGTPRVVRMQMPVSSLADAGLVFEPASAEANRADRSVLADVLLGVDGEPLGVHVVNSE